MTAELCYSSQKVNKSRAPWLLVTEVSEPWEGMQATPTPRRQSSSHHLFHTYICCSSPSALAWNKPVLLRVS